MARRQQTKDDHFPSQKIAPLDSPALDEVFFLVGSAPKCKSFNISFHVALRSAHLTTAITTSQHVALAAFPRLDPDAFDIYIDWLKLDKPAGFPAAWHENKYKWSDCRELFAVHVLGSQFGDLEFQKFVLGELDKWLGKEQFDLNVLEFVLVEEDIGIELKEFVIDRMLGGAETVHWVFKSFVKMVEKRRIQRGDVELDLQGKIPSSRGDGETKETQVEGKGLPDILGPEEHTVCSVSRNSDSQQDDRSELGQTNQPVRPIRRISFLPPREYLSMFVHKLGQNTQNTEQHKSTGYQLIQSQVSQPSNSTSSSTALQCPNSHKQRPIFPHRENQSPHHTAIQHPPSYSTKNTPFRPPALVSHQNATAHSPFLSNRLPLTHHDNHAWPPQSPFP